YDFRLTRAEHVQRVPGQSGIQCRIVNDERGEGLGGQTRRASPREGALLNASVAQGPCPVGTGCRLPNSPSASPFGPALKYSVSGTPALVPLPNVNPQRPSILSAWPACPPPRNRPRNFPFELNDMIVPLPKF